MHFSTEEFRRNSLEETILTWILLELYLLFMKRLKLPTMGKNAHHLVDKESKKLFNVNNL